MTRINFFFERLAKKNQRLVWDSIFRSYLRGRYVEGSANRAARRAKKCAEKRAKKRTKKAESRLHKNWLAILKRSCEMYYSDDCDNKVQFIETHNKYVMNSKFIRAYDEQFFNAIKLG